MNYKLTVLTALLILFTFCNQVMAMNNSPNEIKYIKSSEASVQEYEEIIKILDCFAVYSSYFYDTYSFEGHLISRHGENRDEALQYLQKGFSEEIAFNILDYYTCWNPDINKQVIITTEGLPVLTIEDIEKCSFYIEDGAVSLKVDYYNCYTLGDHYTYYITAHKVQNRYIINDLRLEAHILLALLQ